MSKVQQQHLPSLGTKLSTNRTLKKAGGRRLPGRRTVRGGFRPASNRRPRLSQILVGACTQLGFDLLQKFLFFCPEALWRGYLLGRWRILREPQNRVTAVLVLPRRAVQASEETSEDTHLRLYWTFAPDGGAGSDRSQL